MILRTYSENERTEKLRRISKSPNKDQDLFGKFEISLDYPSIYSTVKDTTNFLWIEKEVLKIHPEIVEERKNGYLGVDYKRLVPLLIQSIKELKQEVEELKKKV